MNADPREATEARRDAGIRTSEFVLRAIRDLTALRGYPPSLRELADEVGRSPANVSWHVDRLVAAGRLRRGAPRTTRSLVVVNAADDDNIVFFDEVATTDPRGSAVIIERADGRRTWYWSSEVRDD